ncbi:MAG: glycosyltransferase [Lachnospiraceae bacterium]|nr:glycosyltransferase [Lachnospiraceae bacterium]
MKLIMTDRMNNWQELLAGLYDWQELLLSGNGTAEGHRECLLRLASLGDNCGLPIAEMLSRLESIFGESEIPPEGLAAVVQLAGQMSEYVRREYDSRLYDSPQGLLKEVCCENVYDTSLGKRALIVYILAPFYFDNMRGSHTNIEEARTMAAVLRDLGYDVDVINTYYAGELDTDRYDLVIGFRRPFEELLPGLRKTCVSVYYTTEASPYFANTAELRRITAFQGRCGVRPSYERQNMCCLSLDRLLSADGAICIGNDWTLSTYQGMFHRCLKQNATATVLKRDHTHKEGSPYGRAFMWYGGAGALHKGVDLCIEAFRELPDLELHLVGRLDGVVYEYYREEIESADNVFYHGFLPPDNAEFLDLCGRCDFSLGVSCSEGQSTAMLTAMRGGVIPVCMPYMGIDAEESGGVAIDDVTITELADVCRSLSAMDPAEIDGRRKQVCEYVTDKHSLEAYGRMLRDNLLTLIEMKTKT